MSKFKFLGKAHETAFQEAARAIGIPVPDVQLILYLLTASPETRLHIWEVLDMDGQIVRDRWNDWAEDDSRRVMALLLNLTFCESRPELSPSFLFDSKLCPALLCAISYWRKHAA